MAVIAATPQPRAEAPAYRQPRGQRWSSRILPIFTGLAVAYLFLPIAVMMLFGFNEVHGKFNFTWNGFTLANYGNLLAYQGLTDALKNSLIVAFVATLGATILGTLIGLALTRYQFVGRGPLNLLIFLPIATPEVVMGASLLSLFVSMGVSRSLVTIVIAHVMFDISYVVITVRARIAGFDRHLEEAAMDLGADEWTTFRKITLPLIFPGILAAALLAFALSIDDFVITQFNAGQTVTFPLWVYGASRVGVPPQVNVMGTLIFVIATLGIGAWIWLQRRNLVASQRVAEAE